MKCKGALRDKSFKLAVRIVNLCKFLRENKSEYVLSKQILRSGTSVGANVRESEHAESRADFIHKLSIAQKEINETLYWLELLNETEYINKTEFNSLSSDAEEIKKIVTSIILTTKQNNS